MNSNDMAFALAVLALVFDKLTTRRIKKLEKTLKERLEIIESQVMDDSS